jgi:nicotinate-nucleotide adenylyltransferase
MGGSFNPVHLGHLRAAEEMAFRYRLDAVCFMPTALPPHKFDDEDMAPFADRLRMVQLAIKGRPGFCASDLERRLEGPSYTVNTLKAVRESLPPGSSVFFLVGFDSFQNIRHWKSCRELFTLASFAVNIRPGATRVSPGSRTRLAAILRAVFKAEPVWDPGEGAFLAEGFLPVHFFEGSQLAISSTDLRSRLGAGESVRYLVPDPVRAYLLRRKVYMPGGPSGLGPAEGRLAGPESAGPGSRKPEAVKAGPELQERQRAGKHENRNDPMR